MKWPESIDGLIEGEPGNECLYYWKLFFSKYFYKGFIYGNIAMNFNQNIAEGRWIKRIGDKIAVIDEDGRVMGEPREIQHLERLYLILRQKIGSKSNSYVDWCKVVNAAEEELKVWIEEENSIINRLAKSVAKIPHVVKLPGEWMRESEKDPERESLWGDFWYEKEIACLYGDSNLGKSIYAMQIACVIAKQRRVLYLDYEMDEGTFSKRYRDTNGSCHTFPTNLYRAQINPDSPLSTSCTKDIILHLEILLRRYMFTVVIIDNLTYITGGDNRGEKATTIIYQLKQLMARYGVSFLIVAHTKKRDKRSPITSEDLMANRRFYHFLDSAFAINRSKGEGSTLYIKQIKCRNREFTHGGDRVVSGNIKKIGSFLCFEKYRVENEEELLPKRRQKGNGGQV